MGRLIDADALIEFLDSERKSGLALHDFSMVGSYLNAIKFVENMPTAYDVEKVVAELEEYKQSEINFREIARRGIGKPSPTISRTIGRIEAFGSAIDIVRKGGVDHDR